MQNANDPAQQVLAKVTSTIDRHSLTINNRDLKAVKILIRVVDGKIQEPELSVDLKRNDKL